MMPPKRRKIKCSRRSWKTMEMTGSQIWLSWRSVGPRVSTGGVQSSALGFSWCFGQLQWLFYALTHAVFIIVTDVGKSNLTCMQVKTRKLDRLFSPQSYSQKGYNGHCLASIREVIDSVKVPFGSSCSTVLCALKIAVAFTKASSIRPVFLLVSGY